MSSSQKLQVRIALIFFPAIVVMIMTIAMTAGCCNRDTATDKDGRKKTPATGETWYAIAESLDAVPYGYQYYSGEGPGVYNGRDVRKTSIRVVYDMRELGELNHGETYREFYMEPQGGLVAFVSKLKVGEKTFITDGEFKQDGLYTRRYDEGAAPQGDPQKLQPPQDVLFAVSPNYVWPLVKDSDGALRFTLFDVATFTLRPSVVTPAGLQDVTISGRTWHTKKYTLDVIGPQGETVARQVQYFDTERGQLVFSETLDTSGAVIGVAYISSAGIASKIKPADKKPDILPARTLPLEPEKPYPYVVKMMDNELGRGYYMLGPTAAAGRYEIEESVKLGGLQEQRMNSAKLFLSGDMTFNRYSINGKVTDPTATVTNVSYNKTALWNGKTLSWETWVRDNVKGTPASSDKATVDLTDRVFLMDSHLVSGFAVLASQVPLYQGKAFSIGVFHAGLHKLGMCMLSVRNKTVVGGKSLYALELTGFFGRYALFVDDDGQLRRMVMLLGPDGERDISYDILQ
jgi:hypothetical protein